MLIPSFEEFLAGPHIPKTPTDASDLGPSQINPVQVRVVLTPEPPNNVRSLDIVEATASLEMFSTVLYNTTPIFESLLDIFGIGSSWSYSGQSVSETPSMEEESETDDTYNDTPCPPGPIAHCDISDIAEVVECRPALTRELRRRLVTRALATWNVELANSTPEFERRRSGGNALEEAVLSL